MLGAIIGDIAGSIYEFNNIKTTDFPFFSPGSSYTDDSIMTLAVADWLMNRSTTAGGGKLEDYLVRYAHSYPCPMGGYGGRFRRWLFEAPSGPGGRQPYNSWGNGSAMRVASVGWLCHTLDEVEHTAEETAAITHNHPEGIKGAQATAAAIFLARKGFDKDTIRAVIEQRYGYNLHRTCSDIRPTYTFDESCQGTVPEAIIAFLESTDFESAIRLAVSLGGDSDTLACITGGIAEAFYKEIPAAIRDEAMRRLPENFKNLLNVFYDMAKHKEETDEKMSPKTNESMLNTWKLDTFYQEIAKQEGVTAFVPKSKEIHLLDFTVAGTTFCKEFDKNDGDFIEEGMTLTVKREDNKHDANAIALYVGDIKIGYVPKTLNAVLARLLDGGKILVAKVNDAHYKDGWEKINACISMLEV